MGELVGGYKGFNFWQVINIGVDITFECININVDNSVISILNENSLILIQNFAEIL